MYGRGKVDLLQARLIGAERIRQPFPVRDNLWTTMWHFLPLMPGI